MDLFGDTAAILYSIVSMKNGIKKAVLLSVQTKVHSWANGSLIPRAYITTNGGTRFA